LASDNSYYADFELKEEEVREVWHVETTISPFNGSPKSLKNGIYDQVDSLRVVIENQTSTIKSLNSTIELLLKSSRSSR
jgi:hypothetical protein